VYLPTRDVGIDLLAERERKLLRVQVKESRTYENLNAEMGWHLWSQLEPDALTRADALGVDLFVFVVHAPDENGNRRRFLPFYVVIRPRELEARLAAYRHGPDRAVVWFRDAGQLWEVRGKTAKKAGPSFRRRERNFTRYLDNWEIRRPRKRPSGRQ
jgi:hypothetical protein